MANVKDLLVNGSARVVGTIYGNSTSANKLNTNAGSASQPVYFNNGVPVAITGTISNNAATATKATQDSAGQQINTTYIKGLSVSGRTITYTKGDGTTGTITTQDNNTTYSAGTGLSLSGTTFNHKNSVTAGTAQGDANKTLTFGGTFTIPTITYDAQGHITGKGTTTMTMPANPNTDTHWTTGITAGATGTTSNSATTNGNTFIKIKDNSTHRGQIKLVGSGATSVSSDANGVITISSTDNNTTYGSMSISEGTTGTATSNRVLTAANLKGIINAHAPTKTGSGASGTWGINISGNASSASKVNNKLTVGSKSYDGSAAVTIAASDLGLASAMLFLGTTTTAITDGAKTNPVTIGGSNKTVTAGNVVLYGSKEFVWTGSVWEELGNEGSYKIVQAAVGDPSASGTSNTFIDTISQDANGKITATKKTVAVTNNAPTLSWGTTSTIGTVAGINLQVKMPANPNTWRGIQNNLTSDSTTDSLSAAQGKVLKVLVDSKAAASHTHNSVKDISSAANTTFAYSKAGLNYGDYTWLAGWNGYELRAVNKSQFAQASHTHNYAGSSSAGGAANSANKLTTARTISLGTGVTSTATSFDGSSNITIPITSIKESYLSWGGKNFAGDYGCIDAAMVSDLGANRLMFGKAAGITIQYSTDGGSNWTDYGASDSAKVGLFSSGYGFNIGKATKNTITANCMLRVIINTDSFGVYTTLNKFVIYLSTNGSSGCYCTIDASLESSPTTFTTFANKVPVSGWSGYNVINTSGITTYGNSPSNQYGLIRFTFGCTSVNTNYSGLSIVQIMGFGGVGWSTPSTMAKTGHLYSYDSSQNATFPATVTAPTFSGSLSGNAATSTISRSLGSDNTMKVYGELNNEVNFGGTNNSNIIYFGYRAKDSKPIPSKFVFGGSNGTSELVATKFIGTLNGNAATATKATQDSAGQQINTTYIKGLSVSGRTITYTKGDGSTGTITTQDTNTTYGVATSSANGLMSSADKSKLDGIATGANKYSHPTSSGNKHIPAGGSSGQILRWSADGTAAWGADTNTWRGIQNNLTSDSTTDSLAAAQGKALKALIDGKAASSHTHNYAGSSSAGGAANSANKLATARTITLSGAVTGSASFDGSKNITITTSSSQQTLPYSSSTSQLFVTTKANQANYTLSNFVDNAVYHVYVNGFKIPSSEYTVSSSGVVTLANPPELANQEVEIVANYTSYVTTDSSIYNSSYLNYYRQATAPSNTNALWLDTSTTTSSSSFTPKLYDGGKWTAIGGGTTCTDAQIDAIFA